MKAHATLDTAGITLSALCIIHCLFLPIMGASLPIIGAWSEVEWVHKVLVLLALPVAASLFLSSARPSLRFIAALGAALLIAAAFWEPFHNIETGVTVVGALLLSMAHMIRLTRMNHLY